MVWDLIVSYNIDYDLFFQLIYTNDVGDTAVNNEHNAKGILLTPDTFQLPMLNLILKDDTYHVIYNNDLRVYIQSHPWQGGIKIYQ